MQVFAVITVISATLGADKVIEMPSANEEYCRSNEAYIVQTISNDLKAAITDFKIKYECKVKV